MGIVDKIISPAASFQRQVFLTMAVGLVLLALTASVTTSWLASRNARQHLMLQAKQVTENFARQSVLALLFGSADNASDSAAATLTFPDVSYVGILDLKGRKLLEEGDKGITWVPPLKPEHKGAVLGRETATSLDFYAPVYTHEDPKGEIGSPFQSQRPSPELIGTVHVEFSKESLLKEQGSIFFNNISLSLGFAFVLLVFLRLLIRRMTT
ncbi:MAG TPA: diguanylate phosphodiesterase, partial [Gammaproteobacteria bacterium]|nr:diguanylate phosphodiesterase [Gammaproteobacteria bacterium]